MNIFFTFFEVGLKWTVFWSVMSTRLTWEFSEVRDNFASFGVTWRKLGGEFLMSHVIENGVPTDVLVAKFRTPIMYKHLMTRDTPR